jgi:hypothetical protein
MCAVSKADWASIGPAVRQKKCHTANFIIDLPFMIFGFWVKQRSRVMAAPPPWGCFVSVSPRKSLLPQLMGDGSSFRGYTENRSGKTPVFGSFYFK